MATRQQLTQDRQVRALTAEAAVYEHAIKDSKGLRIRVSPSGRKSWMYRYRNRTTGALERMVLGAYPKMGLADARDEVDRHRAIVKEHGSARQYRTADHAEKRAALVEKLATDSRAAFTVEKMVNAYLEEASDTLKGWREVDRALKKYVVEEIGDIPAHEVARKDVIGVLDTLNKRGKRVQANRVLAYFRRCCNWAIQAERLTANPCAMIERNDERAKERFLGDAEIRRLLTGLPESGIDDAIADLYRLILLTGLRPGEAVALAIDNIDLEGKNIRLTDTKNGRVHTVPISPQAMAIIKRKIREGGKWLFPATRDANKHLRADALQQPLRDSLANLKILPTTPHDLRRSFATGLASLGAPRLLISLALNHTVPGVTSVYDRHGYEKELRQWFEAWGKHIAKLGRNAGAKRERESAL
jgi:integrase